MAFKEFPADRFDINLQNLDISDNLLTCLEETSLKNIRVASLLQLNATGNQITDIHKDAFVEQSRFQVVDLSSNNLMFIVPKTFTQSPSLDRLSLSNNRGLEMPKGGYFLSSASLRVLQLSNCNLYCIPPQTFQELPDLQELCISHKVIEVLYPVQGVERLTVLDLCHNYFRNLESGVFSAFPKPVSLNLSYNRLSALNTTVMPQLAEVSSANELNGNPWVCDCVMFNTVYSWCREKGVVSMPVGASPPKFKGKLWTTYGKTGCRNDTTEHVKQAEENYEYNDDENKSADTAEQVEETYDIIGSDAGRTVIVKQVEGITESDEKLLPNRRYESDKIAQVLECCETGIR